MLDKLFGNKARPEDQENIGKITSDKAKSLIKQLSGGEVKQSKKIIDNIIVFTNACGGSGASTVMANAGFLAAEKGMRVLIIDLNIMYPSQHIYFAKGDAKIDKPDLFGYLIGKDALGDAIETTGNISLLYANNRTLMDSMNAESDIAVTNFQEAINKVRQLFDLVFIDCPMHVEHALCNTAFYIADAVYMIWDEGIGSISNTEKIRRNMAASGIDVYTKMKVVLNKRTNIHYNNYPFQKLNIELVQILPFEPDIIYSSLRSEIFCEKGASKSKNADIFFNGMRTLTDAIMENGGYIE